MLTTQTGAIVHSLILFMLFYLATFLYVRNYNVIMLFSGYHNLNQVIIWFWEAIEKFDNERRLRLLQVWTLMTFHCICKKTLPHSSVSSVIFRLQST